MLSENISSDNNCTRHYRNNHQMILVKMIIIINNGIPNVALKIQFEWFYLGHLIVIVKRNGDGDLIALLDSCLTETTDYTQN